MSAKLDTAQKKDTDENKPTQTGGETIIQLPLDELFPLRDHPFSVNDDDLMEQTVASIKSYGVLLPAIVRPREEGGYEIIAGHRRHHACGRAGLTAMPCVVRDVDYDTAVILMVDSNIQRENTPVSEKAKAIKMKYEAIKRQGARTDLTSPKISAKLRSDDEIGRQMGMSGDTIRNYMALTDLVPELMQKG